ncbi:MAG: TaqI-like C-terminal specificity domain-containing protein, partial [Cryomorphaceae bacterium]
VSRYSKIQNTYFVVFPYHLNEGRPKPMKFSEIESNYPFGAEYLKFHETQLRAREKGKYNSENSWFLFRRSQGITDVEFPKIMTQEISLGCNMVLDKLGEFYHVTTVYSLVKKPDFDLNNEYLLGVLNSKVLWFFLKNTGTELSGGYFRFKTNYLKPFPIPLPDKTYQSQITTCVNAVISTTSLKEETITKFLALLQSKFPIPKPSKKLQDWPSLDFTGFLGELKKQKMKLSLEEEAEWMDYFTKKQTEAHALQSEIDRLDREIDEMVYDLYGLTAEERKVVEGGL